MTKESESTGGTWYVKEAYMWKRKLLEKRGIKQCVTKKNLKKTSTAEGGKGTFFTF